MVKELTNAELSVKMKSLEGEVKRLQIVIYKLINDMYSLSFLGKNGTEFLHELQGEIKELKNDIDLNTKEFLLLNN